MKFFVDLFTDYTIQTIVMGTAVLGLVSGLLGTWAVLRRQSLLGDAVAHASLPGIAVAFLITGVKNSLFFFVGAALAGWLATIWISSITNNTRIKSDTALAIVLAVFFGFGMVLITFIQRMPNANQAGLESFLFGQAATMLRQDVITISIIAGAVFAIVGLFWKEFKLLTFDPQFAHSIGFNIKLLDTLLNTLIVIAIVLGLQAAGVVLMSALLIAPAAAARQWTNKLKRMAILASIFGLISGVVGTAISSTASNLSTGPVIVLISIFIVAISFLFAPQRGLIAQFFLKQKNKKRIALNTMLVNIYQICGQHENQEHLHSISILKPLPSFNKVTINKLSENGLIRLIDMKQWCLTEKGINKAKQIIENGG
ncbi:MAG: metal ABC transporter permease [Bacteroidales bacterium]|nr:metal ABC transporter permease [Bacteroidales bacterium]